MTSRRQAIMYRTMVSLVACCLLPVAGVTGCESLQRKFTRKPKHAPPRPSPIIVFQDYSRAMTPLDRYRKHSMMFDYWNDELIDALQSRPLNAKRYKHASSEALNELRTLHELLIEEVAARLSPLIDERMSIDRQLQSPAFGSSEIGMVWRRLERQTRTIEREFSWRDVEDTLKRESPQSSDQPAPDAAAP